MAEAKTKNPCQIVIPARFSYLNIFEAVAMEEGQKKKFSASLIISKNDAVTIKKVNAAIAAAKVTFKEKFGAALPASAESPLHDGDVQRAEDEAYENAFYLNAKAGENSRPGLVNAQREPITDRNDIKSGDHGYASITFYPFNKGVNKGIAVALNHLMKTKDGEPLSGRISADEAFADIEAGDGFLD